MVRRRGRYRLPGASIMSDDSNPDTAIKVEDPDNGLPGSEDEPTIRQISGGNGPIVAFCECDFCAGRYCVCA